jgi:RNA polymerase sigma factor (sigma-70 family)
MSQSVADTRASLLIRLRGQDDQAWAEFFRIYAPVVYGYAQRRGLQKDDAEDITQEVLIEVARGIRNFTYQPEKGRFRDWLGTMTWRRIARHWNAGKTQTTTAELEPSISIPDSEWIDEYQAAVLRTALENIRPRYAEVTWKAFWHTWKEGATAAVVAEQLGIPIEIVYNAKSRVLKHLEIEVLRIADDSAWLSE